jgi:hypothetical protein
MATEHDPSALDAPIQPGGVPRHASAKERRSRGIKPFLSDLRAEVQNQLSRAESPARPRDAQESPTQVVYPSAQASRLTAGPQAPAPPAVDDGATLASAALAAADHAGAAADAARTEAASARTEAAASRAEADAARTEAAAARADAVTAQATAGRADARVQTVRAEIGAAHQELEALRAEVDAVRAQTRQHVLIAWIGAGAAAVLAGVALVLPL